MEEAMKEGIDGGTHQLKKNCGFERRPSPYVGFGTVISLMLISLTSMSSRSSPRIALRLRKQRALPKFLRLSGGALIPGPDHRASESARDNSKNGSCEAEVEEVEGLVGREVKGGDRWQRGWSTSDEDMHQTLTDADLSRGWRSGVIVTVGVPEGSEVGLDLFVRESGPKFSGYRSISRGAHYLYLAPKLECKGMPNGLGLTRNPGEWLWFEPGTVIVRGFDSNRDALATLHQNDTQRIADTLDGVTSFDGHQKALFKTLGDPDHRNSSLSRNEKWGELTCHISKEVIDRLRPPCFSPLPPPQVGNHQYNLYSRPFEVGDDVLALVPGHEDKLAGVVLDYAVGVSDMVSVRLKELNSTIQIPSRKLELVRPLEKPFYYSAMYGKVPTSANFRGNLTPEERSMFSMDSSYLFEILFKRHYKNNAGLLLGEIQYAYISSVVGGCVTGLHQWKQLLTLLCNCEKSLERRIELFSELNRILVLQIRFAPKDYLVMCGYVWLCVFIMCGHVCL
ncbi:hypothetical protein AAMO2058_000119300 [Amorphochlora amoebiformis]